MVLKKCLSLHYQNSKTTIVQSLKTYNMEKSEIKKFANQYFFTDVEPYEVLKQLSKNVILVRKLKCTLKEEADKKLRDSFVPGGFVGHFNNGAQEWDYSSDENATPIKIRLHKDGKYYLPNTRGTYFRLSDKPYKWYDYNF